MLQPYASQWEVIGLGLGFTSWELSTIKANPINVINAPLSYLFAMLSSWIEWAPGDARGSKDYATHQALRIVMEKIGPLQEI